MHRDQEHRPVQGPSPRATEIRPAAEHNVMPWPAQLLAGLTQLWEASLDARAADQPHSPVSVLDELLRARATPGETT